MHCKMFHYNFNVSKSIIIPLSPIKYNCRKKNIMFFSVQPKKLTGKQVQEQLTQIKFFLIKTSRYPILTWWLILFPGKCLYRPGMIQVDSYKKKSTGVI